MKEDCETCKYEQCFECEFEPDCAADPNICPCEGCIDKDKYERW